MENYLPFDLDAEKSVAAACLVSPDAFLETSLLVEEEDFTNNLYKSVYHAALVLDKSGKPVDVITVCDLLKKEKLLTMAGGTKAIEDLAKKAGSLTGNLEEHARIIHDKSLLRKLYTTGRTITSIATDVGSEANEAIQKAEAAVFELNKSKRQSSLINMPEAVRRLEEELKNTRKKLLIGHSTGFKELDKLTGGFQPGQLIVLAARPSMGKSALGLQFAQHIAATSSLIVPFLSYEMSANELTMRLLGGSLKYNTNKVQRGDIPAGMEKDIARHLEKIAALPLRVDDEPPETIGEVRSLMRQLGRRNPLGAIVVDYLQLVSGNRKNGGENRTNEVTEISRNLKRLGVELGVPVIALSQLNRGVESRPNKRPMLSDLRESGAIEQDASLVLFLYREHHYNPSADPEIAELIIAKQRSGPTGVVYLDFKSEYTLFTDSSKPPPAIEAASSLNIAYTSRERSSSPF